MLNIGKTAALLTLLGCPPLCLAQPVNSSPFEDRRAEAVYFLTPIFSILDCESVGEIEDGGVDEHFSTLYFYSDRDMSRTIVESEFVLGRPEDKKEQSRFVFKMMDTDGNGQVTPGEYRQYVSFAIAEADLDKNGELHESELFADKATANKFAKLKDKTTEKSADKQANIPQPHSHQDSHQHQVTSAATGHAKEGSHE